MGCRILQVRLTMKAAQYKVELLSAVISVGTHIQAEAVVADQKVRHYLCCGR